MVEFLVGFLKTILGIQKYRLATLLDRKPKGWENATLFESPISSIVTAVFYLCTPGKSLRTISQQPDETRRKICMCALWSQFR